ncbi:hypothetical protein [Pelagibacterium limicola]|uniref:hypothetical protein n=1 Tax=Pelagibacterium limicola TaxID=2791022 RepID=UPI0018AFF876|nr:hypothetical protein [Pelagibacterium limicola]
MRLLIALSILALGLAQPAAAQNGAEEMIAPVPPPRPAHLGGTANDNEFDIENPFDEDELPEGVIIDGGTFDDEFDARPDFSGITTPQPLTLSARISSNGPYIPEGLVWRIFDSRTDSSGELAMVAKSEDATATFGLPPGEYMLHVAFGRAQATDTLFVEPGPNNRTIIFEVGALRLDALITGDIAIPPGMLRFDIYSDGPNGRITVAENIPPGELVHLNAGVYSIVSRFGPINAVIRSELRVEPGQVTEATLYHKAAQVTLKLVSEEGGEAIADVEWTIKTAGGETVFTDIGAFPATVLAEGQYLALAKLGPTVYNREFEVRPGSAREIEILTTVY